MAITRISQSSVKEGLEKFTSFYGGLIPFSGNYEFIASVSGTGSNRNVSLTSIPSTYKHLQLRVIHQTTSATTYQGTQTVIQFNNDTGNNYSYRHVVGNGASATADTGVTSGMFLMRATKEPNLAAAVIDILDYSNTSRKTTLRTLAGYEGTSEWQVRHGSGAWNNTNTINKMTFLQAANPYGGDFTTRTLFALYGIR